MRLPHLLTKTNEFALGKDSPSLENNNRIWPRCSEMSGPSVQVNVPRFYFKQRPSLEPRAIECLEVRLHDFH